MPNVIDNGDTEREELVDFLRKHIPHNICEYEVTEETKHFWQSAAEIGTGFALEDEDFENGVGIAEILTAEPHTITVYDRSFLEDFIDLATKYERYNPNVTVTVIVETLKDAKEE